MTTVIIVGAIVLVVAVGLLVQGEDPVPSAREARSAAVKSERNARDRAPRSARVEERLQRMREPGATAGQKPTRQGELAAAPRLQDQRVDAQAMLPTPRAVAIDDDEDAEDIEDEAKLAETIRSNPDAEERASAIFFLTGGSSRTVVPVLLEALGDPDPEVRLAAVEALDDYSEDLRPETLVPALSDADAEVRFEALGVLGDMEDQDAIRDIAKRMLNDPDDDVRSLAEGILDMEDDA
jgi:HEAT repeat protein